MSNNKKHQLYCKKCNKKLSKENLKNIELTKNILLILKKLYPKNTYKIISKKLDLSLYTVRNWYQKNTKITAYQRDKLLEMYPDFNKYIVQTYKAKTLKEIMEERMKKFLSLLKENPKLTLKLLGSIMLLNRGQVEYVICKLKQSKKLMHKGATKNGVWIVKN